MNIDEFLKKANDTLMIDRNTITFTLDGTPEEIDFFYRNGSISLSYTPNPMSMHPPAHTEQFDADPELKPKPIMFIEYFDENNLGDMNLDVCKVYVNKTKFIKCVDPV